MLLPCAATCPSMMARAAAVARGAIAGASALLSSSAVTRSSSDWMAAALLLEAAVFTAVVATKSTPDGVDLKLSNYSTTAAMNGSIASANNATLATAAANYGLKTVVDQHSLDIAARITPLEVDTKVANALLGAVTAAALVPRSTTAMALRSSGRLVRCTASGSSLPRSIVTLLSSYLRPAACPTRPPRRAGRPARLRPPCQGGRPGPPW